MSGDQKFRDGIRAVAVRLTTVVKILAETYVRSTACVDRRLIV